MAPREFNSGCKRKKVNAFVGFAEDHGDDLGNDQAEREN
jgi:hypothetical protein